MNLISNAQLVMILLVKQAVPYINGIDIDLLYFVQFIKDQMLLGSLTKMVMDL